MVSNTTEPPYTVFTPTMTVNMPPLKPWQLEVVKDPSRFKVLFVGRRGGKTTLGITICFASALKGGRYWWVAPSYPIAEIGWDMLKELARNFPPSMIEIREADRKAVFPGGGEFWIKSAVDPDSLRGRGLDGIVIDECAQVKEEAWTQALRPSITDRLGWVLFIGTPKGKNWFWRLFQEAFKLQNWNRWLLTTEECGTVSKEELDEARLVMSQEEYEQEFECKIKSSSYLVYPTFDRILHCWKGLIPEFISYHGGLDFGGDTIGSHKSAGLVAGRTASDILIVINEFEQAGPAVAERQLDWVGEQMSLVKNLRKTLKRGPQHIFWKADKSQMFGIQLMQNAGIVVSKTKGGADSIVEGIELVQRRLKFRPDGKSRLYYLPHLHFLPDGMERYRYPEPHNDALRTESKKPLSVQDDTVTTLRYLIEGVDYQAVGDPSKLYRNRLGVVRA